MSRQFDCVIIGGGPAGYNAALSAVKNGLSTALVEYDALGGTCLNRGCIPSKALLESSELLDKFKTSAYHGISFDSDSLSIDISTMMARKESIVADLRNGLEQLLTQQGVELIHGFGQLTKDRLVTVKNGEEEQILEAKNVILALGSKAVELPFAKFSSRIISSTEALSLEKIPQDLVIIGAGAIGLELGSVWSRLGSKVTILEMLPQIGGQADKQIAQTFERLLKKSGLDIRTKTVVKTIEENNDSVVITLERNGKSETIAAEKLLVAAGRRPNTKEFIANCPALQADERGFIKVNNFATSIPNVWAIGDCIGGVMLAHKAEDEGRAVIRAITKTNDIKLSAIPAVIYTWPELAQVGLTEQQAQANGLSVKCGKSYFGANGRAKSMDCNDGLVKIVADSTNDKIIGVHILGPHASELIAEATLAVNLGLTTEQLSETCHAHPTLAEALRAACHNCH